MVPQQSMRDEISICPRCGKDSRVGLGGEVERRVWITDMVLNEQGVFNDGHSEDGEALAKL